MIKPTPKVGDLIAYNGAGMLHCSLGLLLEVYNDTANGAIRGCTTFYRILWAVPPSIPPRKEWSSPKSKDDWTKTPMESHTTFNDHTVEGWYRAGDWFPVAPSKK